MCKWKPWPFEDLRFFVVLDPRKTRRPCHQGLQIRWESLNQLAMKLRYRFTKVFEFLERCLSKSMENTVQFGSGKRRQVRTLHSDFCILSWSHPQVMKPLLSKKMFFFQMSVQFSWFINKKKSKQCDGLANLKWKAYLTKGLGQHKESQRYGDQIPENPQRSAGMGNPQAAMAICCFFGWDRC